MNTKIFKLDDIPVPLKLITEKRRNATVSITPRNVIIRLPWHLNEDEKQTILTKHLNWAKLTIAQKKIFSGSKQFVSDYHQSSIVLYGFEFFIVVLESNTSKNKLRYAGDFSIELHLLKSEIINNNIQLIKDLLIKFTNKFFINKIINHTLELNEKHFNETIKGIKLKHSTSKWGACYPDKTLIFSTKLLLFPIEIIEYVIIHELAHLKEMNHSKKFWFLVQQAMPDYKKHVQWLKKHQNEYDF